MTEQEWLQCSDPQKMLEFLRGKASDRKLRLFAVACCRRIWHLLIDPRSQEAIDSAERYADGLIDSEILEWTFVGACNADGDTALAVGYRDNLYYAAFAARHTNYPHMNSSIKFVIRDAGRAVADSGSLRGSKVVHEKANQSILARDIFGNPFRPIAINPAWLTWNDSTMQKIAQAIYDERAFDRMPILADALEEAGCTDQDILAHCRQRGEHVRGCWVVDLLLGKS